MIDSIIV